MAEVESKEAAPDTLSEKPAVGTSTEPAESVVEGTASNKQLVEGKESAEKPDERSEVTEASHGTLEIATKNESGSTEPSKRVQEGRAWHNRDRDHDRGRGRSRGGRSRGNNNNRGHKYRHNIKSDMTSQEESSDPVEIRKQVRLAVIPLETSC